RRRDRRRGARAATDPGLRALPAARDGREARRVDGVHSRRQNRHQRDEDFLRPGPRGRGDQADRPGRHHDGRGIAEHGRRRARRADRAPLFRRGDSPTEQGVRRGVEEGIRRSQHAELRRRRRLGRDGRHFPGGQGAEGSHRFRAHHGAPQGLPQSRQPEGGIDIVADGELSKPGFFTYVKERLSGFEPRPGKKVAFFDAERAAFPEYYKEYFARAMTGGAVAPVVPMVCTGPVSYKGEEALRRDIDNLKAAMSASGAKAAFMPSVAPSGAGSNEHYKSDEEFFFAVADAMRHEYRAIVDAGLYLQIDDPFMTDNFSDPALDDKQRRRLAEIHVEAVNHALRGIAAEKVRFHTCYGINEGPRVHDPALGEVAPFMLKVNASAYSFE